MMGGQEEPEFLPLRGLGSVLRVVLALVVAAIAARLAIQSLSLGSAHWRHTFIDNQLPRVAADTPAMSLGLLAICGALLIAIIGAVSAGPVGSPVLTADDWASDDVQLQY